MSSIIDSRGRMISVRVTTEEFGRFQHFCLHNGIRSVSEGVRFAIRQLIEGDPLSASETSLAARVAHLETQLANLESLLAALELPPAARSTTAR